ncbi:MAG: AI-2E family transporter, partial [Ilumatobacteraceae bacterium]
MASDLGTARPEHADARLPPEPPDQPDATTVTEVTTTTTTIEEVVDGDATPTSIESRRLPRWTVAATAVFWGGFLGALILQFFWSRLSGLFILLAISLFLSLAIEPGVNRLARRGWKRGSATALILFGVLVVFLVFVVAIGALVGTQIAELLADSETYIRDTVSTINETFGTNLNAQEVIDDFNDPNGAVQQFIRDQQDNAVSLSLAVLGGLLQLLSVMLFTFYL